MTAAAANDSDTHDQNLRVVHGGVPGSRPVAASRSGVLGKRLRVEGGDNGRGEHLMNVRTCTTVHQSTDRVDQEELGVNEVQHRNAPKVAHAKRPTSRSGSVPGHRELECQHDGEGR